MGKRNSKTKGSQWATKLLVCFIVLLFVVNLGFADSLSAQGSNENDNGDEDDKDPYSHVQLDPRVVNRAVDEIMALLADVYSIDPLEEVLRNTIEDYIKGDYKEQLIEDIRAVNEALGQPTMTRAGEIVAVDLMVVNPDYLRDRVEEVINDSGNFEDILENFENIEGRSLSGILDGLPMAPDTGRFGDDIIDWARRDIPSATAGVGDPVFIDDPTGHATSGGGGSTYPEYLEREGRRNRVIGWICTAVGYGVTVGGLVTTVASAGTATPLGIAVAAAGSAVGTYGSVLSDVGRQQLEEAERLRAEEEAESGEVEEVEVAGASCECEGDCTCGNNGEQGEEEVVEKEETPLPPDHPDSEPHPDDREYDEDDFDLPWWVIDPAPEEEEEEDGEVDYIDPFPGHPDDVDDNGEIAPPPRAEPDPEGPINGDWDFDEPLF